MPINLEYATHLATNLTKEVFSTELSDIQLIDSRGQVNQVYEVTAGHYKAVLRIHDHTEHARYQKEQWCIEATRSIGVSTPAILHVGRDEHYAYMFLEFISGANGRAISDTNDTWYALGHTLRLIHGIPVAGFGDSLAAITAGSSTQWQRYVEANIQALTSKTLTEQLGMSSEQATKLQELLKSLLTKHFSFGLNHGDYSLANTITHDGIPYVIDWGSAQAHIVPHHDLAVILEESLAEDSEKYYALLSGYQMVRQDHETIKGEIKTLQLLDALDKVRWAMDRAPHRLGHHLGRFKRFVEQSGL